jgi:anti-anti-sigma factor
MAIPLIKNANRRRPRPAYLPMFAMLNPTGYASWRSPMEHTQVRPRDSGSQIGTAVKQFRVATVKIGGLTNVAVVGELEDATCDRLASAWAEALGGGGPVTLDLQACTFIDSVGLDLIVRTATRLHREGRNLIVCNLRGPARELFRITGIESLEGLLVDQ